MSRACSTERVTRRFLRARTWGVAATAALVVASCSSGGRGASISSTAPAPSVPASTSTSASEPPTPSTAFPSTESPTLTTSVIAAGSSAFWDAVPSPPLSPRREPLVIAIGDRLLVLGGRSGRAAGSLSDLADGAILDAAGGAWTRIAAAPVPVGAESAATVWRGALVVVAGDAALQYDALADRWTRLAPLPPPARAYARLLAGDAELYLVGGVNAAKVDSPAADGPLMPPPLAFAATTSTWRELPMPNWPGATTVASAAWTGTQLLLAVGSTDGGDGNTPVAPARPAAALDPVSGAIKPLPATPSPVFGAFVTVDDGSVLLFDQASAVWRLGPSENTWERLTMVPSAGQTSVRFSWRVAGHLVIDTGGGVPGGRSIAYQQASGAWSELGSPLESNDTVLAQTGTGQLFATDGVATARLKPFADRTDGVELCLAAQLEADAVDDTHIEIVNTSPTPCALDGQRPATVDFHVAADLWERAGESSFLRLPAGGDGGYLKPGGVAVMELVPAFYDGRDCPFEHRTFEGMRFSAPGDGEPVPVAVTVTLPCPDVTALVKRASG